MALNYSEYWDEILNIEVEDMLQMKEMKKKGH